MKLQYKLRSHVTVLFNHIVTALAWRRPQNFYYKRRA